MYIYITYLYLQGVVEFGPLRRLVLDKAVEIEIAGVWFQLDEVNVGGGGPRLAREVVVERTGGELGESLHLLHRHSVLQLPLLDQHFPTNKSCMERSHLLLLIEEAHTEEAERDEDADEDNDEDDGVLLAVQI